MTEPRRLGRVEQAPHVFASNPLDRVADLRHDAEWLAAQREHRDGRYLPFRDLQVAIAHSAPEQLGWLVRDAADAWIAGDDPVLLGLLDGVPHFALALDGTGLAAAPHGLEFRDARAVATMLSPAEAGMLAQGRSMLGWHATHRFCHQCGAGTLPLGGGARRQCSRCEARLYPQVSPSMIVLVERDGRCLLARRPQGPPHRFSCLAGYLEPGESIEEAVIREVFEESGIRVRDVRYHSSQPWPFPATLMIGCFAEGATEQIAVDGEEIAEARWFTRDDARRALAGEHPALVLPDRIAIAHHLIRAWVDE